MTTTLTSSFEVKALDDSGTFEGYASVFDRIDEGRDIVVPGAFKSSINERGVEGIKLLWQHDPSEPIGKIDEIYEDSCGLYVKGRLMLNLQRAREALELMRNRALDGLSIGFKTLKSRMEQKGEIRKLLEVDLWEVSLVTFPMQPEARISNFKKMPIQTPREYEHFLRDAGGYSRMEAKALTAMGFAGLSPQRDAGEDWSDVLNSIEHLENLITNKEA